jgi:hypothetical protein
MKNFIFTVCLLSVSYLASANYRVTGTITTICGTTWTYVIYPSNSIDEFYRYERVVWAANLNCGDSTTQMVVF